MFDECVQTAMHPSLPTPQVGDCGAVTQGPSNSNVHSTATEPVHDRFPLIGGATGGSAHPESQSQSSE
jgi:hypothetical protein